MTRSNLKGGDIGWGEAAELNRWGRCFHRLCTHVQTLLGGR